jgi:hypothetical protein
MTTDDRFYVFLKKSWDDSIEQEYFCNFVDEHILLINLDK